jgi:hypothetical protein
MEWLDMLGARVEQLGSIQAVATELGYSRSSISLALSGKYPAKVTKLQAAVITAYTRCECPYLAATITSAECRRYRTRPVPQSNSSDLRHWNVCQSCSVGRQLAAAEAIRRDAC